MSAPRTSPTSDIQAAPGGEEFADSVRREVNERFLEASRGDDFVGIQTYGRTVWDPKFGLIAVDRESQKRSPKPSAEWLGQVGRTNGAELTG